MLHQSQYYERKWTHIRCTRVNMIRYICVETVAWNVELRFLLRLLGAVKLTWWHISWKLFLLYCAVTSLPQRLGPNSTFSIFRDAPVVAPNLQMTGLSRSRGGFLFRQLLTASATLLNWTHGIMSYITRSKMSFRSSKGIPRPDWEAALGYRG
jgi:hypothetical protein